MKKTPNNKSTFPKAGGKKSIAASQVARKKAHPQLKKNRPRKTDASSEPQLQSENGDARPTTHTDCDVDFFPVFGPVRRARREMLKKYFIEIAGKIFRREIDPFEAKEFRRQEEEDEPRLSALRALMGRTANWRDELVFQAARSHADMAELKELLAHAAVSGNTKELEQFRRASLRVEKMRSAGPFYKARVVATLFGWHHEVNHGELPTRHATMKHIESCNIALPSSGKDPYNSNANRIFKGVYLSRFPPGIPWHGSSPITLQKQNNRASPSRR
jgi:hypothetical protein